MPDIAVAEIPVDEEERPLPPPQPPVKNALLDGPTRFEDMPHAMPRILAPGGLCHVITYGTE